MKEMGKGLATAGIWGGIAYTAPYLGFFTVLLGFVGVFATISIWGD